MKTGTTAGGDGLAAFTSGSESSQDLKAPMFLEVLQPLMTPPTKEEALQTDIKRSV